MNRKNLTAAVLAGLAGAAGIAGTAQAVNLNPDGLGQVLIYPYYTTNDGNQTLLSVVNTTDSAKAVKVRFKEGYNSREVLDFNMYMSAYDVWVAAIQDDGGTPTLYIPDTTCTVPYLYENDSDDDGVGEQAFLPYAYTGSHDDGGPQTIARASEGYFEMIEMGTLTDDTATAKRLGSAEAATHVIDDDGYQHPEDCDQLVENWTINPGPDGMWIQDHTLDIDRNSGGLFGGAAIINVEDGSMFGYDARAIQGFDKSDDAHLHVAPGTSDPSLNSGDQNEATIFFGVPKDEAVTLGYPRSVDAISAVFMHEYTMNEYNIESNLHAASEWVITFPTKAWYVDRELVEEETQWIPDSDDPGCGGWEPGDEPFPERSGPDYTDSTDKTDDNSNDIPDTQEDWVLCSYIEIDVTGAIPPFTQLFDGEACELFDIEVWDREENADDGPNNSIPPIVSPPPPGGGTPGTPFEICYEVNIMRFGNDGTYVDIFGTTSDLLYELDTGAVVYDGGAGEKPRVNGWARIDWYADSDHVDWNGLVGLPVTGFWAEQFTNNFLNNNPGVQSNYGDLFQHKGNVRRVCNYNRCED
jgi:hypothetical protein